MDLQGAVVLVTGAAAGTGRAIVLRMVAEGARVAVADIDAEGARHTAALAAGAGGEALPIAADVTSCDAVAAMVARTEAGLGGLDVLVNNAGGAESPPFPDVSVEALDRCIDLNLRGPLYTIREALPAMARRGGAIVNIASVGGTAGGPDNYPAYNAAKAALIRLSETLRPTCARLGVRIGCLAPDLILTDRVRADLSRMPAGEREAATRHAVRPEDVAADVAALARG